MRLMKENSLFYYSVFRRAWIFFTLLIFEIICLASILDDWISLDNHPAKTESFGVSPVMRHRIFASISNFIDMPYNASHQRSTNRVAVWRSDCMRLLGVAFEFMKPFLILIKKLRWHAFLNFGS